MELNRAEKMSREMMDEHGLTDWKFAFDRAKRRFGLCRYKHRQITASRDLTELNSEAEFIDTILHEIAHALVGPGHGHNSVWRERAIEIGCSGNRCGRVKTVAPKFKGICPECGNADFAHKRLNNACEICCEQFNNGKFSEDFRFVWSRVSTPVITNREK